MLGSTVTEAVTHAGRFHADDVFSSALLHICFPEITIKRVFKVPEGYQGLAFDIGGGAYDHHQAGAPVRENGVPYAAFGLLWRELGPRLVGEEEAAQIDEHFVQPLDLDDNTGCGSQLAGAIGVFNPVWDTDEPADACFERAVQVAVAILERKLACVRGIRRARELVQRAVEASEKDIVVLPSYAPWKAVLLDTPAKFVVYPSQRGGYSAQVVPVSAEDNAARIPFPAGWAGKREEELPGISGIPTLTFCHAGRFLISAATQQDAVEACRAAMRAAE